MRSTFAKGAVLAARIAAISGKSIVIAGIAIPQSVSIAYAKYDLPAPYVSKALGAVLIPINHQSRHRYQIPPKLRGVYVLAVSPRGVAARQGIRPGDVLATVRNRPIVAPIDVDRFVWAALAINATNFLFGVNRGIEATDIVHVNTNISVSTFNTTINYNTINNWTSVDNHSEWTQIVNQYNTNINTSIIDNSYRSETNTYNEAIPEPGQNFDGSIRDEQGIPEPGQTTLTGGEDSYDDSYDDDTDDASDDDDSYDDDTDDASDDDDSYDDDSDFE